MQDNYFGSKSRNEFVPADRKRGCRSLYAGWEGREDEQSAFVEAGFPGGRDLVAIQAASGANDDRRFAPQQDGEALFLNRGVKAADDCSFFVAEMSHKIKRLQDELAGAAAGAEQRGERLAQKGSVAQDVYHRRCPVRAAAKQGGGISRRAGLDKFGFHSRTEMIFRQLNARPCPGWKYCAFPSRTSSPSLFQSFGSSRRKYCLTGDLGRAGMMPA